MKTRNVALVAGLFWATFLLLTPSALAEEPVILEVAAGRLSVMPDGGMDFAPINAAAPIWKTDPDRLWGITISEGADPFKLAPAGEFLSGKKPSDVSQDRRRCRSYV